MIENFKSFKLNHALMEVGYVNHQSATRSAAPNHGSIYDAQVTSISMTATMDTSGKSLILGTLYLGVSIIPFSCLYLLSYLV